MDLDSLKQYLMKMYNGSPAGMINSATGAGAQAAGVPAGASPLTDRVAQAGSDLSNQITSAVPDSLRGGMDKTNSFLDMLHDKLFGASRGR